MKALRKLAPCLCASVALFVIMAAVPSAQQAPYYPPAGGWAKKAPAELGLDPVLLQAAIDYAKSRESTREMDFSDPERIFAPGALEERVENGWRTLIASREFGFQLFHEFPRHKEAPPIAVVSPGWQDHVAAVRERFRFLADRR